MNYSKLLFLFLLSCNQSWAKIETDTIVLKDTVTICHFPPGNMTNAQKITISSSALKTHIDHHDDYILTSTEECQKKSFLICHDGVNEIISKSQWQKDNNFKNYYLGSCNANVTFYPLPNPENFIPLPETKVKEFVKLTDISYCDDGGKKSDVDIFDATIKRASVSNAFVSDAVIGNIQPNIIKYGVLNSNVGITDLTNGTVDYNKVVGVDLQNVEITNLFLDTERDYIDSNGNVIDGTYISISGGLLNEKIAFSEKNIV